MEKKIFVTTVLNESRDCAPTATVLNASFTREEAEESRQEEWDGMFDEDGTFDVERVSSEDIRSDKYEDMWTIENTFNGEDFAAIEITEITYDTAVFGFDAIKYERSQVEAFSRKECERLCNSDEENVTKYNEGIQSLINDSMIDDVNCWYRVFE